MKIIIDGNDGVGKSTLAKQLQEDLGIKSYIHLSGKDPRNFSFYAAMLQKEDVIFDRSFMDEPIYAEVLNRKPELTPLEVELLHSYLYKKGFIVIIVVSNNKKYDKNEDVRIIEAEHKIDAYFKRTAAEHGYIIYDTSFVTTSFYKELVYWLRFNSDGKVA